MRCLAQGMDKTRRFCNHRTGKLLSILQTKDEPLNLPHGKFKIKQDYLLGRERVKQLRVVNVTAERGVKIFKKFNNFLRNDKKVKQFLLQVIEVNRKAVPHRKLKCPPYLPFNSSELGTD